MFRPGQTLTVANAKTVLDDGLRAIANGQMHFDLSELGAVDSAAVVTMLAWQRAAHRNGKALIFAHAPASLQSLCELYGVSSLVPLSISSESGTQAHAELPQH